MVPCSGLDRPLLEDLFSFVRSRREETLTQALLAVPMFTTRWRWNATRALAVYTNVVVYRDGLPTPVGAPAAAV